MWSGVTFVARVGATAFVGLVGLYVAFRGLGLLKEAPGLEAAAWIVGLAIIAVDNVATLFTRSARKRRATRDKKIQNTLMNMLITLSRDDVLRFEELGASVYIPSAWDRLWRRNPKSVQRLTRIIRFRPSGHPAQSGIAWTPKKGAVGEAWRLKRNIYKNWHALAKQWAGEQITEEGFKALNAKTTLGFTYEDFVAIVDKYSEVVAEPIWHGEHDRRLLGVLSIDRSYIASPDTFQARFGRKDTLEITAAAASAIGGILKPMVEEG